MKGSAVRRSGSLVSEGNMPAAETGQLSRGLIVDAAIDLIDRGGPESLTMRGVCPLVGG